MKLYIAEKPSLGRAIAEVLPKPHVKGEGFIRVGNGDCVSWCIGHLLEQAEPDAYDPAYKKWSLAHLPIMPTAWQLNPKRNTKKQLQVLRKLVKEADSLVHAGDPDREGQLLVDEVVNYLKVPQKKLQAMQRCLISDLNPKAVQNSLAHLRDNKAFIPLSVSALARSRADWIIGMNMTRACSLQGQAAGYRGVLSVGRVQTPILGLVVRRDEEIKNFVVKPYFEVWAKIEATSKSTFYAKWQPSEACAPYQDEEGRILSKPLAENVVGRITGKEACVLSAQDKEKRQAAPLPYNLSALQIDAAKAFGLPAKQVLDICQALYERHKLITYPRSDCRYLPLTHLEDVSAVRKAICHRVSELRDHCEAANWQQRSKAWNDGKVSAHHAIIPTARMTSQVLSKSEMQIYSLIARQYVAQFLAPWRYVDQQINMEIAGGVFIAKARSTVDEGWKTLFKSSKKDARESYEEPVNKVLPKARKGDVLVCLGGECREKKTQPPKHFTDALLLSAITGIARFVTDADVKKILKETDGLGTEATRAGIIELLFKRQYLERKGKQIHATEAGRQLIAALPEDLTRPDMTARWELNLNAISQAETSYADFMADITGSMPDLIDNVRAESFAVLSGLGTRKKFKKKRVSQSKRKATG